MSNWCKHYNGAGRYPACKAGIDYRDVRVVNPGHGNGVSFPCTPNMNEAGATCSKLEFYTPEEIAEQERQQEEVIEAIANGLSPCCKEPLDESQVIPSGPRKGHGRRFCPRCGRVAFIV